MQAGQVVRVRTVSTAHFTGALAKNGAAAIEHLAKGTVVPEALAAGNHVRSRLREIRLWSVQKLAWAIQLWSSAVGVGGANPDVETFLAEWSFAASGNPGDGSRATGDTFFYYYINGQDVAYEDKDLTGKIHLRVINRDAATDKLAGAGGAIVVELALEPLHGRP